MKSWLKTTLSELVEYRKEKITYSELNERNYISTDNMLNDRNGVISSRYVPLKGKSDRYFVNDILFSNIRPYFKKIWHADSNGGCSNDILVFKASKEKIDINFLYYCLSNQIFFDYVMSGSNGTKMPRGNKNHILKYKIELPPKEIQKKISSILKKYDDLIKKKNEEIILLENKIKHTYEEWFLRKNSKNKIFWKSFNINEIYEIKYGKNLSQDKILPSGKYPVYGAGGIIGYFHKKNTSEETVLVTSRGNGSSDVSRTYGEAFVTNNSFIVKPKKTYLSLNFTFNLLKSIGLKNYCNGSAQPQLTNNAMKNIKIKLPNKEIIEKFKLFENPINQLCNNLRSQILKLKKARDIMQPRLISGEIDIDKSILNL